MKLLIASDIHGSAYWCSKLMDAYQNEKADRMILLGDILYHGPRNALPKEYDPQRVCDLLNQISDRILCVRGNCDADVDQWLIHFPIMADYSWIMEKDRVIYLTRFQKRRKLSAASKERCGAFRSYTYSDHRTD